MTDTSNYEEKMTVWAERKDAIRLFDITHPRPHSIHRDGDFLCCRTCSTRDYAPAAGPRPKDSMEASLSRFD